MLQCQFWSHHTKKDIRSFCAQSEHGHTRRRSPHTKNQQISLCIMTFPPSSFYTCPKCSIHFPVCQCSFANFFVKISSFFTVFLENLPKFRFVRAIWRFRGAGSAGKAPPFAPTMYVCAKKSNRPRGGFSHKKQKFEQFFSFARKKPSDLLAIGQKLCYYFT